MRETSILGGIDLDSVKRRQRFQPSKFGVPDETTIVLGDAPTLTVMLGEELSVDDPTTTRAREKYGWETQL